MKKLSIVIGCYNEEENIMPLAKDIVSELESSLPYYDYEIIFIDNASTDNTRVNLRHLCAENRKIKAILNARNFGSLNSGFYGLLQSSGDCVIKMCCDFQDPVDLLPQMVKQWEEGYKIVTCIKSSSKENIVMRLIRTCYYKTIRKMSSIDQIEHFTGFGLYDKSFIGVLRELHDPIPFLRGIVAELGYKRTSIYYEQPKRRAGKSSYNMYRLFDAAMLSFTSYTKVGLHVITILGMGLSLVSLLAAIVYFTYKLLYWDRFSTGLAPLVIGMFFFNAIELLFIGLVGEYVMSINTRVMNRPLVIEEERINFEN